MSNNNDSKNRIVAPFTIEKNYGKGKIIFVNAIGYFDAIFKNSISPNNDIGKEKIILYEPCKCVQFDRSFWPTE